MVDLNVNDMLGSLSESILVASLLLGVISTLAETLFVRIANLVVMLYLLFLAYLMIEAKRTAQLRARLDDVLANARQTIAQATNRGTEEGDRG